MYLNCVYLCVESEDDPTDVPQLCSDLELSISLNPGVVPLVGELVAALASEGM